MCVQRREAFLASTIQSQKEVSVVEWHIRKREIAVNVSEGWSVWGVRLKLLDGGGAEVGEL